jgi:serine/threonine protein kinase
MIDLLKLGISLVKLVERLHDIGIVHLDIKPDNIVVSQEKDQLTRGNTITNFKIKDLEELMEHDMR